jgi:hypothetical protein
VVALRFTDDGRRLISGSQDTTALVWDATGVLEGRLSANRLTPREMEELWSTLLAEDSAASAHAVRRLSQVPAQSVPFLKERWRPAGPIAANEITRLIAELDEDQLAVREKATAQLARLGRQAEPALRRALETEPPPSVRIRIEALLGKLPRNESAEEARTLRVVEVLQRIGTPAARQVIESMALVATSPRVKEAARAALQPR